MLLAMVRMGQPSRWGGIMNQSMGYPRSDIRDNTRVDRIPIVRVHNKRLNTRRFIAHVMILMISKLSGIGVYVYF